MTARRETPAIVLFSEILIIDQLVRARLGRVLPRGMELNHFMVLNHLAHVRAERTPAQLARLLHVTKGAMTNTLGKLETAGHIHVRPDWEDARRKMVVISPAGRLARDQALGAITPLLEEVLGDVGTDKAQGALPMLRALRVRLEDEG